MKKIFFEKVNGKYVPISEYDNDFSASLGYGDHLLSVYKNGSSRQPVVPAFAPMIAAGRHSKDAVTKSIQESLSMRPTRAPLTKGQLTAWRKLTKEFGDEIYPLTWPAAQDAADAAVLAMQEEADKLLTVPAVKNAYDHFMMMCALTKETQENT
jgi:hypothetical protein